MSQPSAFPAGDASVENRSQSPKIELLIVGQATIDDIYREGEGLVSENTPGGDSIYSVLGASIWPLRIGVVTRVGKDYPRDKLASATCNPELVDWSGVRYIEGPSIHDKAYYYRDGSRKYVFNDDTLLDSLSPIPSDIPSTMGDCPFAHIAPANVHSQLELIKYFRSQKTTVTIDVESHFFMGHEATLLEMLRYDPIFIPSLEHIQKLSGIKSRSPKELWPWIQNCGSSMIIVKCGEDGAWVFDVRQRKMWRVGVVPGLKIADVTGAGDSFCGGFLAGLILSKDPVQAAVFGSVSASFIVESWAAVRPSGFSPELAEHRLALVRNTVSVEPFIF